MNVIVFVKEAWDRNTELDPSIIFPSKATDNFDIMLNKYDKHAIEAALHIKEKRGGEITVVSLCSKTGEKIIREAIAMGCDRGIRIDNESRIMDHFVVAQILVKAIEKIGKYDLLLFGTQGYELGTAT
ncbi:MAG: hypothetical protein ACFFBD_03230, partial [Candidatus Hodarchaeota archaeon]